MFLVLQPAKACRQTKFLPKRELKGKFIASLKVQKGRILRTFQQRVARFFIGFLILFSKQRVVPILKSASVWRFRSALSPEIHVQWIPIIWTPPIKNGKNWRDPCFCWKIWVRFSIGPTIFFGRNQDIFHFSKQFLGEIRIFSIFPSNFWETSGYFPFFQAIFGRNQDIFHFSKQCLGEIRIFSIFPSNFWEKSGDLSFFQRNQEIFHFSKQVLGEIRRSSIFPKKSGNLSFFQASFGRNQEIFHFSKQVLGELWEI